MNKFLQSDKIKSLLVSRGVKAEDIGYHSLRKGAATYVTSGTTACPPMTAVHLRAGWTLGGIHDTYFRSFIFIFRYESAGDMFVGRTVSGLPIDSAEFSILPPYFEECNEEVKETIKICFPTIPQKIIRFFYLHYFDQDYMNT